MSDTKVADPVTHGRTPLRRRYAFATVAILAVVAATLSVSFAADSGTSTAAVTGTTSAVGVYDAGTTLPTTTWNFDGTTDSSTLQLPYGSILTEGDGLGGAAAWSSVDSPSWSVAGGASGTVSTTGAGDLAYLDASGSNSTTVLVSVYVTNMAELAVNYTSWAFNIELHQATAANADSGSWISVTEELVTSDSGTVTFIATISSMDQLALTLEDGGSYYVVQTNGSGGELGPEFFIRSTQL